MAPRRLAGPIVTPWLAVALAACFAPVYDAPRCGPGDTCPAPLVCQAGTCVAPAMTDAAITDGLDAAVDSSDCQPHCELRDQVAIAVTCAGPDETCPLGCTTAGGVHCRALVPSNGVTADDVVGAGALTLDPDSLYVFDTDGGTLRRFPLDGSGTGFVIRASGQGLVDQLRYRVTAPAGTAPGLAILGVRDLTIPPTTVLRPLGARALVIVARDSIVVQGEIDVGAGRAASAVGTAVIAAAGAGGQRGCTAAFAPAQGCAPGGIGGHANQRDTGGGGGGFGTAGGRGGPSAVLLSDGGASVPQAMLGAMCPQTALVPLRGGSGGGCGFGGDDGGGGGGALQLTSFTSILVSGGTVYAGGAGGDGSASRGGGGGAGAGGGILIEAPTILVDGGRLITSGGGGGDGAGIDAPGENGRRTGATALGSGNGGRGATGLAVAAGELPADDGTRPASGMSGGTGGGGGGAGVVHLRSVSLPNILAGVIRPSPGKSVAAVE